MYLHPISLCVPLQSHGLAVAGLSATHTWHSHPPLMPGSPRIHLPCSSCHWDPIPPLTVSSNCHSFVKNLLCITIPSFPWKGRVGWVASWADARKKEVSIGPWYSNPIPHSELPFSPGVGRTLNFYPDLLSPLAYAVRSSASEVQHHTLLTFFFFFTIFG